MIDGRIVRLAVAVHRLLVLLKGDTAFEGLETDCALVVTCFSRKVVLLGSLLGGDCGSCGRDGVVVVANTT